MLDWIVFHAAHIVYSFFGGAFGAIGDLSSGVFWGV